MRIILALSLLLSACAYCGDQPLIVISGVSSSGGGKLDPGATNAVLEAAYAYTDLAISKAYLLTEAHITPDGSTNIYPSTEAYVMPSNTLGFFLANNPSLQGVATFEVVAPVETPVYVAVEGEIWPNNAWELLFTCGTIGQPIEFYLVATVQPTNVDDKSARQVIFKLRRTF